MNNCVLAIDIGIRNLSLCVMSCECPGDFQTYKIHLWGVYDTLDTEEHLCKDTLKNKKICNKKCKYKYLDNEKKYLYCCKSHFPKNMTIQKTNHFKKKNIKDYLLQDIALIVLGKLQKIYDDNITLFEKLSGIYIELQPKINSSMKFTSHIIYGKLAELMKDTKCIIRFVRASQKLKAYTGPYLECKLKGAYAKRKWLSIQYTKWFLENKFSDEERRVWLDDFLSCGKADDRSDGLLMALNALNSSKKSKKQKTTFKKSNMELE